MSVSDGKICLVLGVGITPFMGPTRVVSMANSVQADILNEGANGPMETYTTGVLDKNRSTAWTVRTMPTGFSVSVSKKKMQPPLQNIGRKPSSPFRRKI